MWKHTKFRQNWLKILNCFNSTSNFILISSDMWENEANQFCLLLNLQPSAKDQGNSKYYEMVQVNSAYMHGRYSRI